MTRSWNEAQKTTALEAVATPISRLTLTSGDVPPARAGDVERREAFSTQRAAGGSVDGWNVSNAPISTMCRFRLGTQGSPVAASNERCGCHRGRAVVLHGRGCRHIPGRPDPSLRLRTFGCRRLRKEPRRCPGSTSVGRWRAVEPFSRDFEGRDEWNTDCPSIAERLETVSGNGCGANTGWLPAQRDRRGTGCVVAWIDYWRRRCRRALARRQPAPRDRGSPWGRIDHPVPVGTAFS